jgi:hypothetical protein
MSVTWETFERYRQKGLDARRAGQWDSARIYLLEAARAMAALSKGAMGEELREGRRQMAQRLLELARDCDAAAKEKPSRGKSSPHWAIRRIECGPGERNGRGNVGRPMDREGKILAAICRRGGA